MAENPKFTKVKETLDIDNIFVYLENTNIQESNGFVYWNYSPNEQCERMYLTSENAQRIDFIRESIEEWKNE